MFCKHCGEKLVQEVKFCTFCGKELLAASEAPAEASAMPTPAYTEPIQTPVAVASPSAPRKSKGRYLLCSVCGVVLGAILLAVILFSSGVISIGNLKSKDSGSSATGGTSIEGAGYDSPEEAAEAYLEALKDQDLDAMLATIAFESYVENFDFEAGIERLNSYNSVYSFLSYPNTCEYTTQLNIAARRDQIAGQISLQYLTYNVPEALNEGMTVTFADEAERQDFVSDFEKATEDYIFEDLKITGTIQPEDLCELYLNENNRKYLSRWVDALGVDAEDIENVVITFEADGKTWVFIPQVVRYDDKWYIEALTGNLSNLLGLQTGSGGIMLN